MIDHKIDMEIIISKFLRIGMILSAITITIGMLMFLLTGESGYEIGYYPVKIKEILIGIINLKSYGIIMGGILILILMPVGRVLLSLILFYKEKDMLYVKITAIVLFILILSFAAGK